MKIKSCKASVTVEASFILPIFFFSILCFIYFIKIIQVQEEIQWAMTETANSISVDYQTLYHNDKKTIMMNAFQYFNVNTKCKVILKKNTFHKKIIVNGIEGISFFHSRIIDDEYNIDLIASYKMVIPIPFFEIGQLTGLQRFKTRAFVGDDPEFGTKEEDGEYVYVAENGKVYHRKENCSYLSPGIKKVLGSTENLRNDSGGKYYACEKCAMGNETVQYYYITTYGTKFHRNLHCPGLKRTYKKVLLSEVGNLPPCKKCGGTKKEGEN